MCAYCMPSGVSLFFKKKRNLNSRNIVYFSAKTSEGKHHGSQALLDSDLNGILVNPDGPTVTLLNEVKSAEKPLFLIHPIEGSAAAFSTLTAKLSVPCYGLQCTKGTDTTADSTLH